VRALLELRLVLCSNFFDYRSACPVPISLPLGMGELALRSWLCEASPVLCAQLSSLFGAVVDSSADSRAHIWLRWDMARAVCGLFEWLGDRHDVGARNESVYCIVVSAALVDSGPGQCLITDLLIVIDWSIVLCGLIDKMWALGEFRLAA
jgi:hypothetical protein